MDDCIFCKIGSNEIETQKVYENEQVVAFNDLYPKASIHILVIPKKHIESVNHVEEGDKELIGELFLAAKHIAQEQRVEGYKLAINVGRKGGQEVDHLHIHLLAEKE